MNDMNVAAKLDKSYENSSSSSSSLPKKAKKRPSPRNPMKDLNSACVNPRLSGEAPRGGCFSFFGSNSPSSRHQPRTPKSAPPKSITLATINLNKSSNAGSDNPNKLQGSSGSSKPKWNSRGPRSKDPILKSGHSSKGKCTNSNLSFEVDLEKNGCKGFSGLKHKFSLDSVRDQQNSILGTGYVPNGENSNPNIRLEVNELTSGYCPNSTPEKNLIRSKLDLQSRENTPNSNTTPPIQASSSPEIACGSNTDPAPACFSAGHVISGVQDRRKCRPRGILTVGEGCGYSEESLISSALPPVEEASIQWLSSPSENVSGSSSSKVAGAPINWFVFPSGGLEENESRSEVVGPKVSPSSDPGFWRVSPKIGGILGLSSPDFESTPSSGNDNRRTPTSGSSISPFSAIVQRANHAVSGFKFSAPHKVKGGYRCGSAAESTPVSGNSWGELSGTSTPSSSSKSRKRGVLSPLNLESMTDIFGSMRLSPRTDAFDIPPPLPDLSFQFGFPGAPLNSTDMTRFKQPLCTTEQQCSTDNDTYGSELRISWRDGLVSRIFEMGELDHEENANCLGEDRVESKSDLDYGLENKSLVPNKENGKYMQNGSGSFEFHCGGIGAQESKEKVLPPGSNLCAESISTDGGLISSGDSDWTLFYKNHLFEV